MKIHHTLTRRSFIKTSAVAAAGTAITGCATNPVTGKSQFMLISESGEVNLDARNSPHQLSADYGVVQDQALNAYINDLGLRMASTTHRPNMPYSFQGVNATYLNAYAFPGGTIAFTRGILLDIESEDELAAVMGHELGHVNMRHTASRMSSGMLVTAIVAGVTMYVESEHEEYAALASGLGGVGAGLLLAHYSRADEREADALGLEYMANLEYNPNGMVDLMQTLMDAHDREPNVIERMFSTHPMSRERFETARKEAQSTYSGLAEKPYRKERYMDMTAGVRAIRPAIEQMQKGDKYLHRGDFQQAKQHYSAALSKAPNDYAGLLLMANCCMALKQKDEARRYAQKAREVYPEEPQAEHVLGVISLHQSRYGEAHRMFESYKQRLPGNPNTLFFNGLALEGMGRKQESAEEYARFINSVNQGQQAQYAYQRLVDWGFVQPQQQ